jgi:hypothetical protein
MALGKLALRSACCSVPDGGVVTFSASLRNVDQAAAIMLLILLQHVAEATIMAATIMAARRCKTEKRSAGADFGTVINHTQRMCAVIAWW